MKEAEALHMQMKERLSEVYTVLGVQYNERLSEVRICTCTLRMCIAHYNLRKIPPPTS